MVGLNSKRENTKKKEGKRMYFMSYAVNAKFCLLKTYVHKLSKKPSFSSCINYDIFKLKVRLHGMSENMNKYKRI